MNPVSFHYTPNHRYERYVQAFARVQPSVALILDPALDDYRAICQAAPGARIILRNYAWSDGELDVLHRAAADPVGTGRWMAQNWIELARSWGGAIDPAMTYFTGVNEYTVIPGLPIPPFVQCEAEFARTLANAGYRACICNLGVGHPAELNSQQMVDWSLYAEWEPLLQATGGLLGLHEYWRAEFGPRMNVKPEDAAQGRYWYAWRFMQCPFDVPIAITEWGVDQKVDAPQGTPSHGWQGLLEPGQYADQLAEYVRTAVTDKRFVGATIFTHDYASDEWATYDTDRGLDTICSMALAQPPVSWYVPGTSPTPPDPTPEPEPEPVPGVVVHPLPKGSYTISQRFNETYTNPNGHEGTDLGAAGGVPVGAMAAGFVAYAGVDPAYGNYVRVFHEEYMAHTFYAHLSRIDVHAGEPVAAGQQLGAVGTTGNSTGTHLHLEVRLGGASYYSTVTPKGKGRIDPESWAALYGLSLATGEGTPTAHQVYAPLVSA